MGFIKKSKENLKILLSLDIFLKKYPKRVRNFRRSPLSQGVQEIPIKLQGKGSLEIFTKMKHFVLDNYLKPKKSCWM